MTFAGPVRDIRADHVKAYLVEYEACRRSGLHKRAEAVAEELRRLGHDVAPVKETAASTEPLERAVEAAVPKRRGRPRQTSSA